MVNKEFEEDDPFLLIGMALPMSEGKHIVDMAETFIEEFLRMGWPPELVLGLFKVPFYRGPYIACQVLGEERIRSMIEHATTKNPRRMTR